MSQTSLRRRDHTIAANGINLHVVEVGAGPPVLLLHGFPEFWYSWRHQLEGLAAAGFRALAPDLRGYNDSDHPGGVAQYRVWELVADAVDLIRSFVGTSVYLVGHDWGGIIAWRLTALHPELVKSLVILNAPHPASFSREMRRNPLQWIRSSYAAFFQLPWLPERILQARQFALIESVLRNQPRNPGAFSDSDIREYTRALSQHGLTGPLNYYRAALRYRGDLFDKPDIIQVPTLLIWGERDAYLSSSLASRAEPWVRQLKVARLPHASHWVQNDAPQEVNELLLSFFGS